jgi:predicted ATP-grasp superfamily ATP-dependent carboligase
MNELVQLSERPAAGKYMIAGWHQWADAGSISSGLPQYLIAHTRARRIGTIRPDQFYLFQIPGAHHLLRPVVKLDEGYREELEERRNEFFYSDDRDFLVFLGEEPHQNEERYAEAFLDAVEELGVERVAAVAGVYGPVPYDRDRDVSCVYSLRWMKEDLSQYAVRFSNYEGGATINTYIAHKAEPRGIEFFTFYAIVPSYDFSTRSIVLQAIAIGEDFKAWYDLMRRLNRMFDLGVDLSDLEGQGKELSATWAAKIDHLAETMPQLGVKDYIEKVNADFTHEHEQESFDPLSDVWEDALRDLFDEDEGL